MWDLKKKHIFVVVASLRYPYNWRAPLGYFITSIILGILFICEALIYTSCNILFFGTCKFLVAFCADFKDSLKKLDETIIDSVTTGTKLSIVRRLKLRRMFNDVVQFHCDMIDLAEKCSSTYNGIVATFIFIGGCYWCTNLIEVHLVSKHFHFLHLLQADLLLMPRHDLLLSI